MHSKIPLFKNLRRYFRISIRILKFQRIEFESIRVETKKNMTQIDTYNNMSDKNALVIIIRQR